MSDNIIVGAKKTAVVIGAQRTVLISSAQRRTILIFPRSLPGIPGQGVPTGGTAGQVLAKVDGTNYNTHWIDQSGEVIYQESVTYAQLSAKISASELEPGLYYLITDFRSSWYHLDGGAPINSPQYGSIEPIVVTAIAANKIASLAYSTVHPSDVIYYDWDAANWNTDAFYSIGGTIIPGWRGVITERIDTLRSNRATFNFRAMTFRRWGVTAPAYNNATTYNLGDVVKSGNFLFLCKRYDTTGVATTNTERWVPVLGGVNINTSKFWATNSSGIGFEIPDIDNNDVGYMQINGDGTSQDYLAFPLDSRNMNIVGDRQASLSAANFVTQGTSLNVNSSGVNCTLGDVSRVVIETGVSDCYIANSNTGITIKNGSARIISGIQANIIVAANNFVLGDGCTQIVGQFSFGFLGRSSSVVTAQSIVNFDIASATSLTVGANNVAIRMTRSVGSVGIGDNWNTVTFDGVVFASKFGNSYEYTSFKGASRCNLGNGFSGNTLTQNIQDLSGGDEFTSDDYSTATQIYEPYSKTLLYNRDGEKRLQYLDASDNIVTVSNIS